MYISDLVCSDQAALTQQTLGLQLVPFGQAVVVLGLQGGDALLHHRQLGLGIVKDELGGLQVLLSALQRLLRQQVQVGR